MDFQGRENELRQLRTALRNDETRVICVSGERGVGKTTLASHIFTLNRDSGYDFETCHSLPAHEHAWDRLLDDLFRLLCPDLQGKRSLEVLVQNIIDAVSGHRYLLFIDNIEAEVILSKDFNNFLDSWVMSNHESVLLMTTREDDSLFSSRKHCFTLRLEGFSERGAILKLLGESLRNQFSDEVLLEAASKLRNIPQKLLYLRWLQPRNFESLSKGVEKLGSDATSATTIGSVRHVLSKLGTQANHFKALGLLREIELNTDLLRFLWSKLVGGDSEDYEAVTAQLLDLKLLMEATSLTHSYRIHPDVHLDLRRICEAQGRRWCRQVHLTAVDYYKTQSYTGLIALNELVYHTLTLQDFDTAFGAIFHVGSLERWHNLGSALQLEPILHQLREAAPNYSRMQQAQILIELASIYSDMSRHLRCLDYLHEALRKIEDEVDSPEVLQLRRDAWRLIGISNGDIGNTTETISYYTRVISSDPSALDPRTALCMGYLGYVYCDFKRFDEALKWTEMALKTCPQSRDPGIFAKNLCNRALVLFNTGDVDGARTHLERAALLVGGEHSPAADTREHGRVLGYLGMVYLAQQEVPLKVTEQILLKGLELDKKSGDLRRVAMCQGRLGLVEARRQHYRRASTYLRDAIWLEIHLSDYRNLIFNLLNFCMIQYLWIKHDDPLGVDKLLSEVIEMESPLIHPNIRDLIERTRSDVQYIHLLDFWFQYQRSLLFPKRKVRSSANQPEE